MAGVLGWLRSHLVDPVPRQHWQSESAFRRRRAVTAITLVAGAALLGSTLSLRPGSPLFYPATALLALVWTIGAFASGPLHLGHLLRGGSLRRPLLAPVLIGLGLVVLFLVGALAVRQVPTLASMADSVLAHARAGLTPVLIVLTMLNGLAEEVFFRGALYAAVRNPRQVLVTTVAYTLATLATGNVLLSFAAAVLGVVVGLQRRASGGVLGPMITHVTWSGLMLVLLPMVL